jgi:hypothetical protein
MDAMRVRNILTMDTKGVENNLLNMDAIRVKNILIMDTKRCREQSAQHRRHEGERNILINMDNIRGKNILINMDNMREKGTF